MTDPLFTPDIIESMTPHDRMTPHWTLKPSLMPTTAFWHLSRRCSCVLVPMIQMIIFLLSEVQPRFIVMFELNQDFVRRIVYRSWNTGLGVRVYFMVYQLSCEEHKYLAGIRREKEPFQWLIKGRGSMLLPIMGGKIAGASMGDSIVKTISSRMACGQKELIKEPLSSSI